MKLLKPLLVILLSCFINAKTFSVESYNKTLNLGIGVGYYDYLGSSTPVIHLNYELEASRNFTLAPFISFYTYNSSYYYSGTSYYSVVVLPIGVKGTYYFDELLMANEKWDFYAGASLGFSIRRVRWESNFRDDRYLRRGNALYLDVHVGAEYHFNKRIGMFLDLSSGVSTFGIAFH